MTFSALSSRRTLVAAPFLAVAVSAAAKATALTGTSSGEGVAAIDLVHGDGRTTRYRVLSPDGPGPAGVVLFSHGAKSSAALYERMLHPWRRAGLLVIAPDHMDHDGEAPEDLDGETLWRTRLEDMVLPLANREAFDAIARAAGVIPDWSHIAVAGHSYGGLVAEVLAGARTEGRMAPSPALSVACVVALSPPGPIPGFVPEDAWAPVRAPALLQTGTADVLPGFIADWRRHKAGFEPAVGCERLLLTGEGVDHFFGGLICKPEEDATDPSQAEALAKVAQLTATFLRAHLMEDALAAAQLEAASLRQIEAGVGIERLSTVSSPSISTKGFGTEVWRGVTLRTRRPGVAPWATLVFLPGAACRADRYEWLGDLAETGVGVIIVDAPAGAGLADMTNALERARRESGKLFCAGHSAGAALVLDALDPASGRANPRMQFPDGYSPPADIAGIAVLGSSLQPRFLSFTLPYRSEDSVLSRPGDAPLLFLSGDHDAVAPPASMERTRLRYRTPSVLVELGGGTHYGFTEGSQPTDNPAADLAGAPDTSRQRANALSYIENWMLGRSLVAMPGDRVRVG